MVVLRLSRTVSLEVLLAVVRAPTKEAVVVLGPKVLQRQRQSLRGLKGTERGCVRERGTN